MNEQTSLEYDEISCGVIPIVRTPYNGIYVCIVQHSKGGHWTFPKGHSIDGETPHVTAERELTEETKLKVQKWLSLLPIQEEYTFFRGNRKTRKRVIYYYAEVEQQDGVFPSVDFCLEELQNACFIPLAEIEKRATFPEMKKIALTVYQTLL